MSDHRSAVRRIVAYVPDLMDRSKVAAAAEGITFVGAPVALPDAAAGADLVVVDLNRPGVLDIVAQLACPVIGFSRHTEREMIESARAAGCTVVLARSAFFPRLSEILAGDHPAPAGS